MYVVVFLWNLPIMSVSSELAAGDIYTVKDCLGIVFSFFFSFLLHTVFSFVPEKPRLDKYSSGGF